MNFSIIRRCVRKENEFVLNVDLNKLKNGCLPLRREYRSVKEEMTDKCYSCDGIGLLDDSTPCTVCDGLGYIDDDLEEIN